MRKFTLGLNATKNTDYIEKCFNQEARRIKFRTKTQWMHISIYPKSGAGALKFAFLKYYNVLK